MESGIIRNYLDTYFSTIPMLQDNIELSYDLKIASSSKKYLKKIAKIIDEFYLDINVIKEDSIYVYTVSGDDTPFENIIHNILNYVLSNGIKQNITMFFSNFLIGIESYVVIDSDNISFKNYIDTTESNIYEDKKFQNVYEDYILSIIYSLYHLYNNDLFNKETEVLIQDDLFDCLKAYIDSQKNYFGLELALEQYPNIFTNLSDFKNAITINPKLFLQAPKDIIENKKYLQIFLEVIQKYEDRIYDAVAFVRINHNNFEEKDTLIEMTSDVYHKNMRFIPTAHEMAIAYENSLPFLRKKSTHNLLIHSFVYCKLICLTEKQFQDKTYMTELQNIFPFFYSNIYFYHAFYILKHRKFSDIEQIEKDNSIFLSESIDIELFDFFVDGYSENEHFSINLNYALLDTMCQFGIFIENDFDQHLQQEEDLIKKTTKKYFS
jgi:hypothetical protein